MFFLLLVRKITCRILPLWNCRELLLKTRGKDRRTQPLCSEKLLTENAKVKWNIFEIQMIKYDLWYSLIFFLLAVYMKLFKMLYPLISFVNMITWRMKVDDAVSSLLSHSSWFIYSPGSTLIKMYFSFRIRETPDINHVPKVVLFYINNKLFFHTSIHHRNLCNTSTYNDMACYFFPHDLQQS